MRAVQLRILLGMVLVCLACWPLRVAAEGLLPAGLAMQAEFRPGFGETIGRLDEALGQVTLMHGKELLGYRGRAGLPLFLQDTVVTGDESRALLQFNDQSSLRLAAATRLLINRAVYNPAARDRSTFLGLDLGKARFWVKKLPGFRRSEFEVKTRTMVAGVRGSDFVLKARADRTEVYTLADTQLEVVGLALPNVSVRIGSYQAVIVELGQAPGAVRDISPAEAAALRRELPLPIDSPGLPGGLTMADGVQVGGTVVPKGPPPSPPPGPAVKKDGGVAPVVPATATSPEDQPPPPRPDEPVAPAAATEPVAPVAPARVAPELQAVPVAPGARETVPPLVLPEEPPRTTPDGFPIEPGQPDGAPPVATLAEPTAPGTADQPPGRQPPVTGAGALVAPDTLVAPDITLLPGGFFTWAAGLIDQIGITGQTDAIFNQQATVVAEQAEDTVLQPLPDLPPLPEQ